MKYIEDAYVLCPFYRKESAINIVCEGAYNNTSNIMRFNSANSIDKEAYKERYCKRRYEKCSLCIGLMSKYKEQ